MKIWIDDFRTPPDGTWYWALNSGHAINCLKNVIDNKLALEEISFDHDLGPNGNGYHVACYIESRSALGEFKPVPGSIKWAVHSANPVGRQNIEACMRRAERFWEEFNTETLLEEFQIKADPECAILPNTQGELKMDRFSKTLDGASDAELKEELERRQVAREQQEKQEGKQKASARISELVDSIRRDLREATDLAQEHVIPFSLHIDDLRIEFNGEDFSDSSGWDSSGCSY